MPPRSPRTTRARPGTPLADRLRPRTLDEVVGQDALVGRDGVLRTLVGRGELPSIVLWGPPGCGKTTIARLLAAAVDAEFVSFSAVTAGVKEARAVMAGARTLRGMSGRRTVLFVDEVHHFNRAQQDAFLPFIESGDVIFVGATTENPSFELNSALLSRVKVYVLDALDEAAIAGLLDAALADGERGLASLGVSVEGDARATIANLAGGDARVALNLLEMAAEAAGAKGRVDLALVRQVSQQRLARYDKEGEEHYNLISALHKSVRNSDPDAGLYWLARMLEGGADPRFVARRLLRVASEDVGMADPQALLIAVAAQQAVQFVGMPEANLALAQAVVHLATAPKGNSLYQAYSQVQQDVQTTRNDPVPLHLRNPVTRLMKAEGYGKGYKYAHDFPGNFTKQRNLPDNLQGRRYYIAGDQGYEAEVKKRLKEWWGGEKG